MATLQVAQERVFAERESGLFIRKLAVEVVMYAAPLVIWLLFVGMVVEVFARYPDEIENTRFPVEVETWI